RLKPHTIGQSYGLAVARRLGLPPEITRAAEEARPAGSVELEQALQRLEAERAELKRRIEELRAREAELAEHARAAAEEAERAREKLGADRARLRAEAAGLIEDFRRQGSELLQELKSRTKSARELTRFTAEAQDQL